MFFLIGTRFVPFLYYFCRPKAKLLELNRRAFAAGRAAVAGE